MNKKEFLNRIKKTVTNPARSSVNAGINLRKKVDAAVSGAAETVTNYSKAAIGNVKRRKMKMDHYSKMSKSLSKMKKPRYIKIKGRSGVVGGGASNKLTQLSKDLYKGNKPVSSELRKKSIEWSKKKK